MDKLDIWGSVYVDIVKISARAFNYLPHTYLVQNGIALGHNLLNLNCTVLCQLWILISQEFFR